MLGVVFLGEDYFSDLQVTTINEKGDYEFGSKQGWVDGKVWREKREVGNNPTLLEFPK